MTTAQSITEAAGGLLTTMGFGRFTGISKIKGSLFGGQNQQQEGDSQGRSRSKETNTRDGQSLLSSSAAAQA